MFMGEHLRRKSFFFFRGGARGAGDQLARRVAERLLGPERETLEALEQELGREIEEAGADALELNIYYVPTDPEITASELEDNYVDLVAAVRQVNTTHVPSHSRAKARQAAVRSASFQ